LPQGISLESGPQSTRLGGRIYVRWQSREAGDRLDEGECSSRTLEDQACFILTLTFGINGFIAAVTTTRRRIAEPDGLRQSFCPR
jgi:hypothetical protein